jgi:acid phosphatase
MNRAKSNWVIGLLSVALIAGACGSPAAATPPPASATSAPIASQTTAASPTLGPDSVAPASESAALPSPSVTPTNGIPAFRHIYVIIMENQEYSSIVGSKQAPYLNSLIARYGVATDFYAETHPSEPNYIALTSGGLQGTNSDGYYNLSAPNLFDQIEAAGKTWHVYAQDYPGGCFAGSLYAGAADGPGAAGEYARKHNPAISYASIVHDPARCARITHLAGFDPAAADFEFIVPNQINDMHSSSVAAGDDFLKVFVPQITESAAFADSVVFITWDEGSTSINGGGRIATIAISPGMTPGSRFSGQANHYSLLRTIEEAWGMPYLGEAAQAKPLAFPY